MYDYYEINVFICREFLFKYSRYEGIDIGRDNWFKKFCISSAIILMGSKLEPEGIEQSGGTRILVVGCSLHNHVQFCMRCMYMYVRWRDTTVEIEICKVSDKSVQCRLYFAAQSTSLPPSYKKTNIVSWKESALCTMHPERAVFFPSCGKRERLDNSLASLNTPGNSLFSRKRY